MKRKLKATKQHTTYSGDIDFILEVLENAVDDYKVTHSTDYLLNTLQFLIEDIKNGDAK